MEAITPPLPALLPNDIAYYGNLPVAILRHIAHGLYEFRMPGGGVVTDHLDPDARPAVGTHYATTAADLMEGTYYRMGAAWFTFYARGAVVAKVTRLPDQHYGVVLDAETAKLFLP